MSSWCVATLTVYIIGIYSLLTQACLAILELDWLVNEVCLVFCLVPLVHLGLYYGLAMGFECFDHATHYRYRRHTAPNPALIDKAWKYALTSHLLLVLSVSALVLAVIYSSEDIHDYYQNQLNLFYIQSWQDNAFSFAQFLCLEQLFDGMWFYMYHYFEHQHPWFRQRHMVHHQFKHTAAIASFYFDTMDDGGTNLFAPLFSFFFLGSGTNPFHLVFISLVGTTLAVIDHSGYGHWIGKGHHEDHHENMKFNFALYKEIDQLLGTCTTTNK